MMDPSKSLSEENGTENGWNFESATNSEDGFHSSQESITNKSLSKNDNQVNGHGNHGNGIGNSGSHDNNKINNHHISTDDTGNGNGEKVDKNVSKFSNVEFPSNEYDDCDTARVDISIEVTESSSLLNNSMDGECEVDEKVNKKNLKNLTLEKTWLEVPGRRIRRADSSDEPSGRSPPLENITLEVPQVSFAKNEQKFDEVRSPMFRSPSLQRLWSVLSQTDDMEVKKKEKELHLKIFVGCLFLVIVGGVIGIYVVYRQHLLEIELGKSIRFNEDTRVLTVTSGGDPLYGHLGVNLPYPMLPMDCALNQNKSNEVCLRWKGFAQMKITYSRHEKGVKCYRVSWSSLSHTWQPKDCYGLGGGHWYGGAIMKQSQAWPIDNVVLNESAYVSGYGEFGSVTERLWVSSQGISISVDSDIPLFISQNSAGNKQLCFASKPMHPYYAGFQDQDLQLKYTVCSTSNSVQLLRFLRMQKSVLKRYPNVHIMKKPIITLDLKKVNLSQELGKIQCLSKNFSDNGLSLCENFHFELRNWQAINGDLSIGKQTELGLEDLRARGCSIVLDVDTFADISSQAFKEGALKVYWVRDAGGEVVGLMRWNNQTEAVLDVTNPPAVNWFLHRLTHLRDRYNITSFKFSSGEIRRLPKYGQFFNKMVDLNNYTTQYIVMTTRLQGGNKAATQVDTAFSTQNITQYTSVSVPMKDGLRTVIPKVLTYSVLGYHFVIPEMDFMHSNTQVLPDKNLYIRWIQIMAFLPVMKFSNTCKFDSHTKQIVSDLITFHQNFTVPRILNMEKDVIKNGDPIIRPIWWLAPKNEDAQKIDNQFLIGDTIMVAPVVNTMYRQRRVFIPNGKWTRRDLGLSMLDQVTGPKWVNYRVSIDSVLFFTSD